MADMTGPGLAAVPAFDPDIERLPKLCGADVELGNFILGVERARGSGAEASRAILREIEGFPDGCFRDAWYDRQDRDDTRYGVRVCADVRDYDDKEGRRDRPSRGGWESGWYFPDARADGAASPTPQAQDWGRRFLTNGGCAYVDLDHLEICLPEVLSASDFVAAWHAMLLVARQALERANARQSDRGRIQVLVNTSDGSGNSYGSHINVLIAARTFENLFHRKLQYLLHLAAFHASAIVFAGQGKVGSENGTPHADYQISQRADFLETLTGPQTTWRRPVVNSRDEPLCGPRSGYARGQLSDTMARLHVIAYDSTLSHVATFLKVGTLQIVLAMIEAEAVAHDLTLDDPLDAVLRWSHDPTLQARARLASGEEVTAIQMQQRFLDAADRFIGRGGCRGIVPEAELILETWGRTLSDLDARNWDRLTGALDWVLKRSLLEQAIGRRSHLTWRSPEVKHLDHLFSSLDEEGLYWACERAGVVERVVEAARIAAFTDAPPADTRAWTRATLLSRAGRGAVADANWDRLRFCLTDPRGWRCTRAIDLANPLGWTREAVEAVFQRAASLEEVLEGLDGLRSPDDLSADGRPAPRRAVAPTADRRIHLARTIVH